MSILKDSFIQYIIKFLKSKIEAKQDKLVSGSNIKTINGTSVLGAGNITIEGGDSTGDVDEGRLVWSDEDSLSTLMDIAYLNGNGNKIAGIPPSLVTIEYSADNGATWVDSGISDANKTILTNHRINGNAYLRPNGSTTLDINYQTRITIDLIEDNATNAWVGCFDFRKIILKCSGIQKNDTHTMTIEMQKYGSTTWDIIKTSRFWGSPGFFSIPTPKRTVGYPSSSYYRKVRLTWQTGDVYTNAAGINGVYFMSDNTVRVGGGKVPSQYAITGTPYSIDYGQNATFPANVTATKHITKGGTNQQVVLGDGSLRPISELSPITDADADILLDNHIHNIDVYANGNNVNISVIESSKNGNTWETEDNDIPIPLATTTSAGVMSKEDKAKLDGNISIEPDSGMSDFIGDFEYSDVDYEAIIDLTTVDWINWVEGGLFVMNAEETWEEDNGDTSYHQCVVTFIYRANGCIPISIVNTNKMTAKMSGMVITINLTEGTGELRFKQIKLI